MLDKHGRHLEEWDQELQRTKWHLAMKDWKIQEQTRDSCRLGALVAKGAAEAGRHEGRNAMGKGDGEGSKWKAVGKGNGERETWERKAWWWSLKVMGGWHEI